VIDAAYVERVVQILCELGVSRSYGENTGMPLCVEAQELVSVGSDIYDREQRLIPRAAIHWHSLMSAARRDGVTLLLVSGFRSLEYQKQIFARKLAAGEVIASILRVSAPPGFSEHHTGRAIDLTAPGCAPLTEDFERTSTFEWLVRHARDFGFTMTYPRDNKCGIIYEPWHWALPEIAP